VRRSPRRARARSIAKGAEVVGDVCPALPDYVAVRPALPRRLWRRLIGRPVTDADDVLRALRLPSDY
jgi:spermidine synthase